MVIDEPTKDLDPLARKQIWDVLSSRQRRGMGRGVVLISTSSMAEADGGAGMKGIFSLGQLKCCGSSLFLRNRFGEASFFLLRSFFFLFFQFLSLSSVFASVHFFFRFFLFGLFTSLPSIHLLNLCLYCPNTMRTLYNIMM